MQAAEQSVSFKSHAMGEVTIRRVTSPHEYDECVVIQRETWGRQFSETVPATILKIAQEVGGVTAAAFAADSSMLGFVFGISGIRDGELAHWSDMLAVRPVARDMGLGRRLKHFQRALLVESGVRSMYWTFDPLVARNANLNIGQLGARISDYCTDYYGADTGSVMHTGIGTDRFIVRWRLDADQSPANPASADPAWRSAPIVSVTNPDIPVNTDRVRIAIPDDIIAMLDDDPPLARAWRDISRLAFTTYLAQGFEITGFTRSTASAPATYLLQRRSTPTDIHR